MDSNSVSVSIKVNLDGLQSGMQQAQSVVASSTSAMDASVQKFNATTRELNEALEAASQEGVAAIHAAFDEAAASGATFAEAAEAGVAAYKNLTVAADEAATATNTFSLSARQAGTAGIGMLEGRLTGSTRAASAFLSTTLGLGPVLQAAFPVIGAVALGEVLIDLGKEIYNVSTQAANLGSALGGNFWTGIGAMLQGVGLDFDKTAKSAADLDKKTEQLRQHNDELYASYLRMTQGPAVAAKFLAGQTDTADQAVKHQIEIATAKLAELQKTASQTQEVDTSQGIKFEPTRAALDAQSQIQGQQALVSNLLQQNSNYNQESVNIRTEGAKEQKAIDDAANRKRLEAAKEAARKLEEEAMRSMRAMLQADQENAQRVAEFQKTAAGAVLPDEQDLSRGMNGSNSPTAAIEDASRANATWAEEVTQARAIEEQNNNALAEMKIRTEELTGQLTAMGAAHAMAALHAQEQAQKLAELNDQLKQVQNASYLSPEQKRSQTQGITNQINTQQGQGSIVNAQDTQKELQLAQQEYTQFFNKIDSAFQSSIDGWLRGTQTFATSMQKVYDQLGIQLTNSLMKMGLEVVKYEAQSLAAHVAGNAAKNTSDAEAQAQHAALTSMNNIKEISSNAATAATSAYTWGAAWGGPVVGALMAAAAFTAVEAYGALASFDVGTQYVPSTGVAMIHQGERIIPADDNRRITAALGSPQSGQAAGTTHIHNVYAPQISGIDGASVAGMARTHGRIFMRENMRQLRRMNLTT